MKMVIAFCISVLVLTSLTSAQDQEQPFPGNELTTGYEAAPMTEIETGFLDFYISFLEHI